MKSSKRAAHAHPTKANYATGSLRDFAKPNKTIFATHFCTITDNSTFNAKTISAGAQLASFPEARSQFLDCHRALLGHATRRLEGHREELQLRARAIASYFACF